MGGVPGPRGLQRLSLGEEGWSWSVLFSASLWLCPSLGVVGEPVGSGLAGSGRPGRDRTGVVVEEWRAVLGRSHSVK